MKNIFKHQFWVVLMAGIFSCHKPDIPVPLTPSVYHITLYDHTSREKLTGLKAEMGNYTSFYIQFFSPDSSFLAGPDGSISFIKPVNYRYLKIVSVKYVEAFYVFNVPSDPGQPTHSTQGDLGKNVVNAKFLRAEGNDYYFEADLYRNAAVDLHIKQVSDFPSPHFFNAKIEGVDPAALYNIFGTGNLFGDGLLFNGNKKIDTTIRVYAFGEYLNKASWSVYDIVIDDTGFDTYSSRKIISNGSLPENILPLDKVTDITITF